MNKSTKKPGVIYSDYEDIELPNTNVWNFLYPYYQKFSDLTAIICSKTLKSYTYKQQAEMSLRWAKELEKYFINGSPPTVAILLPNCLEISMIILGTMAVGATVVPIKHDYNSDIVLHFLQEAKATVLVIDSSVYELHEKVLKAVRGTMKIFVRNESDKHYEEDDVLQILSSNSELYDVEKARKVDPESIALISFSSGTTGTPKGIVSPHRTFINNIFCYVNKEFFPFETATDSYQESIIGNLPFAHIYGIQYYFVAAVLRGCRIVALDFKNWENFFDVLEKFKPSLVALRGYMFDDLVKLDIPKTSFESIKTVVNVGSLHNPATITALREKVGKHLILQEHYGSNETGMVTVSPVNEECLGRTGKLPPCYKAYIEDLTTGEPVLEPFQHGEIIAQCPGIMKEYLNNPEATKAVFIDDESGRWIRMGDAGYFDEKNFLCVVERIKDIITVNGKKVYPSSIEQILKRHDAVADVGVIGAIDATTKEEVPKALVVRAKPVKEDELVEFVQQNAPSDLWLRGGVTFVDKLPRNHLGKLERKLLREVYWSNISAS